MMNRFKVLTGVVFMLGWLTVPAQNLSNKGREFWVGYGHHQFMEPGQSNSQEMVLYLSAEQAATVKVSINGTSWVKTYNIPANTVIVSDKIPKDGPDDCRLFSLPASFGGNNSEGVFNRGIHIESNVPLVAYAHIYGSASSGATMLMPTETWGYNYVSVNSTQNYGSNCFSWMFVVATYDNTAVEIIPSVKSRGNKQAGVPFTITLQKGQVYQLLGALTANNSSTGFDLTGTVVRSKANSDGQCYPIGVFSGSSRTSFGCTPSSGSSGDNIIQQVFPFQAWGKRYLTAPTSNSSAASSLMTNIYRIAVKDPNTVVKRNGVQLTGLINNFYYTYNSNTADYIESDKPIMVAQYISSSGACPNFPSSGNGDPEMMYISPIEQAIKRVGFYRNTQQAITTNFLTLIIPTTGVSSLKIDGTGTFDHSYPHPNLAGYTVVVKRWSASPSQCIVQSDSSFTAVTYGLGSVESYGYNAGTLINNLNVLPAIHNVLDTTIKTHDYTCSKTPVEIAANFAYNPSKLVWKLSTVSALSPNANITIDNPVPSDSLLINGTKYYTYKLPGVFQFSDTGLFDIPILSTHPGIENCTNTEEVKIAIRVRNSPPANFTFQHSGCVTDSVSFTGADAAAGYTFNSWNWTFPNGVTASSKITKQVLPVGQQQFNLRVVTTEGCVRDSISTINIFARPVADITVAPASMCEGIASVFSSASSYGGNAQINGWYWDFGNGIIQNPSTGNPINYTYPTPGTYTVKHVVKVSPTCISDTLTKLVSVFAKPKPGFNYPAGCLPIDGVVQFQNTSSTPDNQAMSYNWDFGDAAATPSNPNNSTAVNPTHFYATGSYNIKLTVTTANGCTKDTVVAATFNVKPLLAFAPIPTVCDNAGPVSVATASVTNGVGGSGVYKGPGTTTAGQFNSAIAGPGQHTIWYVFTSTGGCKDSISQKINVSARPRPSFTYPAGGCLPVTGLAQFTNGTTIADAQAMTYLWNFGDQNATPANPNTSTDVNPTHNYSNYGTYTIKLTATSNLGCSADTTVTASFSVKPELTFGALASICENGKPVSVASGAVTNGVSGTGVYRGPGTNAAGSFNPALAGQGNHTIWYVFTSTGGCRDSISGTIRVYAKPSANFTMNSNICLDQQVTITPAAPTGGVPVTSWNWDLGDGNSVTRTNDNAFAVSYSTYRNYTVKLVTLSDNNCASDTFSRVVGVHPLPVANFTMPAAVCMPNGTASFTSTSTIGNNSAMTGVYELGDGSTKTGLNVTHTYAAAGDYRVKLTVTTAYGCTADTVKLFNAFYNKPQAEFVVNNDKLCEGADNVFTDRSGPSGSITAWQWNFDDGTASASRNPSKKYTAPGAYDVQLTVTNSAGCKSDPYTKEVIVYLQPKIDAGPNFVVPQGTTVIFNAKANDSTSLDFSWSPGGDLSDPTILRPSLVAIADGTFTLTAVGDNDCMATDFITVKILKPVKIPNAFSPNGDGMNDKWEIINLSDYPGATVEVFNRYGQKVFYSSGYGRAWDGRMDGKALPLATYYYVIQLKNGFPPLTGSITIIR
jgi:gliding motility-associated-like protein